ncbi:Gfo/Idh/MocA family protein [uncultured Pseudokineococcus sp.]|uniref:Gfo/Idh/MocA family protein n=1 Tax=uncultured Pseudokineococcus sp. TaxID=1642928 RepID=UPI00262030A8|nr:Gfo/Idh/MocA family oxidoreductase [uncultured Pseudokineococcus sp.]
MSPSATAPASRAGEDPVRVGLVGLGNSGWSYHAEQVLEPSPDLRLVAVCDADPARAAAGGRRFGARSGTRWQDLVAQDDVELVVVALPHHLHREVVLGALAAGRHVHVEKPLATSRADATAMVDAARRAGRRLTVHHQRRWEPDFLLVRRLLEDGAVGALRRVEMTRTHAGRYRVRGAASPHTGDDVATWTEDAATGGGVGWLIGPHPVDQVLQLAGRPTGVAGAAHHPPGSTVEDHLRVELDFAATASGAPVTARLDVHRRAPRPAPRFLVTGERGTLASMDGTAVVVLADGRAPVVHAGLVPPGRLGEEVYAGVVAALRGGPGSAVTGEQGRDVVDVLERALAAARGARSPGAGSGAGSVEERREARG